MEKDLRYAETIKTCVIIPIGLPQETKFNIASEMIQLFNMKGVFVCLSTYDANMHIINMLGF